MDRRAHADARQQQQQVVASSSGRGKRQRMHEFTYDQPKHDRSSQRNAELVAGEGRACVKHHDRRLSVLICGFIY